MEITGGGMPWRPTGRTTIPVRCFDLSPLFATLTKTPGVWGYSSHFGTRARKDHSRVLPALRFQLSIEDHDSVGTVGYGQNLQSRVGTSFRSCRRRCK